MQRSQCRRRVRQGDVRHREIGQTCAAPFPLPAFALFAERPGFITAVQLSVEIFRYLLDAMWHIWLTDHGRFAATEYPRLLAADAFTIVA
ncbi:hypothetical protein D3C76_1468330 [compost metagenome]